MTKNNNNLPLLKSYNANKIEIGVDEAGRGPLFGPVYSAAVILPKDDTFDHSLMKDSKKFHSKKKLEQTYNYIIDNALSYGVGCVNETVIDQINIRQATFKAMHMAIEDCLKKYEIDYVKYYKINSDDSIEKNTDYKPLTDLSSNIISNNYLLLIDGNDFKPLTYYNYNSKEIEYLLFNTIEGGDNKYTSIAAASIIAKYERDKYIEQLVEQYPELNDNYGILSNKGYGAKRHIEGIKEHGITKWHRRTYGICSNYT